MAEVRFPVFFSVARTVMIKRELFTASLFQWQVVLCQLHSEMTQFELLCKHISAQSVKGLHFFYLTNNKSRGLWLCLSVSFSVLYSPFDCLFSGLSQVFLSLFALPSYATCRCWDYCCAYLVRCWILFMTLSCVPTVKRLIKHLYLPQIPNLWALFFTCL